MSPWKISPPWTVSVALAGSLAGAVGTTVWWRRRQAARRALERWAVVTVLQPQDEVSGSDVLGRLRGLGPDVEVELREAPGQRGTEVAARHRPGTGRAARGTSRADLRTTLRELKQTLEAGEVLQASPRPEGKRPPTPGGLVIDLVDRRARGEGVL